MTPEERRVYNREYYLAHMMERKPISKEKAREYNKRHYDKNKDDPEFKEKRRKNHAEWLARNRDRWNAYVREYRMKKKLEVQG